MEVIGDYTPTPEEMRRAHYAFDRLSAEPEELFPEHLPFLSIPTIEFIEVEEWRRLDLETRLTDLTELTPRD
jgi:hypothetical protein